MASLLLKTESHFQMSTHIHENGVFANFPYGERFQKVAFSSHTCGREAKNGKEKKKQQQQLLRFQMKRDMCGQGLSYRVGILMLLGSSSKVGLA